MKNLLIVVVLFVCNVLYAQTNELSWIVKPGQKSIRLDITNATSGASLVIQRSNDGTNFVDVSADIIAVGVGRTGFIFTNLVTSVGYYRVKLVGSAVVYSNTTKTMSWGITALQGSGVRINVNGPTTERYEVLTADEPQGPYQSSVLLFPGQMHFDDLTSNGRRFYRVRFFSQ